MSELNKVKVLHCVTSMREGKLGYLVLWCFSISNSQSSK